MFKVNDTIATVGIKTDGIKKTYKVKLAVVVEVALHDLIVEPINEFWRSHIRISKSECHKIPVEKLTSNSIKVLPEINDLVLYYKTCNYMDKKSIPKKEIGLLTAIEYSPGRKPKGFVTIDNKLKEFILEELIILEKHG
tara:strand:+ start:920 stop:1336 length:417 start_codon:yes stop_codon:yes gene_type:complete